MPASAQVKEQASRRRRAHGLKRAGIVMSCLQVIVLMSADVRLCLPVWAFDGLRHTRSEEHTSELQSQSNLVCRLLLEKKKKTQGNEVRVVLMLPIPFLPWHASPQEP